jgi:RNA recognition motif-containing protein
MLTCQATRESSNDVGANLFVGNLDPDVDERQLMEVFSQFGVLIATPKIMRYVSVFSFLSFLSCLL